MDDRNTTMYRIVVKGSTYEHCRMITKNRDRIKFTQGNDEFEFVGFRYTIRKEKEECQNKQEEES